MNQTKENTPQLCSISLKKSDLNKQWTIDQTLLSPACKPIHSWNPSMLMLAKSFALYKDVN